MSFELTNRHTGRCMFLHIHKANPFLGNHCSGAETSAIPFLSNFPFLCWLQKRKTGWWHGSYWFWFAPWRGTCGWLRWISNIIFLLNSYHHALSGWSRGHNTCTPLQQDFQLVRCSGSISSYGNLCGWEAGERSGPFNYSSSWQFRCCAFWWKDSSESFPPSK